MTHCKFTGLWETLWPMTRPFRHAFLLQPAIVKQLESLHEDAMKNRKQLLGFFPLHLELQKRCVPLQIKNDSAACAKSQHTHDDILSAFVNWAVEPSRSISCEHDVQVSEHSSFGGGLSTATLLWLRSIKCPCEDVNQGPLGFASGSSWLELGLSWSGLCANHSL